MAQGKDGVLGEEPGVVDGSMVDHLDKCFVFICDVDVAQIDQAICASRKQNVWARGVKLKLAGYECSLFCCIRMSKNLPRSHHHCEFQHISAASLRVLECP